MKQIGLLISTMNSGGAERVVSHLSKILEADFQVYTILFEDTYQEYTCGGTQCCLQVSAQTGGIVTKFNLLIKRIVKLSRLIQEKNLDCVISFMDSPNFVNLLAFAPKYKKIISIRNYSGLENKQTVLGKVTNVAMKLLYRRADCVITVSNLIGQDFALHYGIPKKKLKTIYNPYDFSDILEKAQIPLGEEETALLGNVFSFATVGRIMYQKGIWHLVKAFSLVNQQAPNTRLVIVGEDLTDGKLAELIQQLHLEKHVLLTGRTRNPYQYMNAADCYVLSSLFEGFPNAMVEAMVCNCCIIATDCKSGPREILYEQPELNSVVQDITEADFGILVPPLETVENWNADVITDGERKLAQAMLEQYRAPQKTQQFAALAKKRSYDFGFERCRELFKKVIE